MEFDKSKITSVEIDGISMAQYPDFTDAYIASANYEGRPMTEDELEELNNDSDFVGDCVQGNYPFGNDEPEDWHLDHQEREDFAHDNDFNNMGADEIL